MSQPNNQLSPTPADSPPGPKRKRVTTACDKCRQSKARCDGKKPCQHCEDYGYLCAYTRESSKRGRRPVATYNAAAADKPADMSSQRQSRNPTEVVTDKANNGINGLARHQSGSTRSNVEPRRDNGDLPETESLASQYSESSYDAFVGQRRPLAQATDTAHRYFDHSNDAMIQDYDIQTFGHPADLQTLNPFFWDLASGLQDSSSGKDLGCPYSHPREIQQPSSTRTTRLSSQQLDSPVQDGYRRISTATISQSKDSDLEGPHSMPSQEQGSARTPSILEPHCRYTVLSGLVPHIKNFISIDDACDLLDLYFTDPSNSLFGCPSPYVITQIFRKSSFLKNDRPRRKTSKALLTAMLWVTAQTSDSSIFTDDPCARSLICDKLFVLCLEFLSLQQKPKDAVHSNLRRKHVDDSMPQVTESCQPARTLDEVLTYALIGLVISSRENRKDSLSWYNQAWALAKELNLNLELEDIKSQNSSKYRPTGIGPLSTSNSDEMLALEEVREERRRVWWLLYIADRHLALSYNTPLRILDVECQVYQPLEEDVWQDLESHLEAGLPTRYFGPSTTMTGTGLFEFFLPLTAILGDIIDIHHQRFHPRLGLLDKNDAIRQIESSLATYETSLKLFEESAALRFPDIGQSLSYSSPQTIFNAYQDIQPWSCDVTRVKAVIGYSTYLLHVLHVLLHANWDPISMLDDEDSWFLPQSFAACTTKTILAATAVSEILKVDPELSFMPYLFGIYLLHGSFYLLVFADRIDMTTSETIGRACETMIRAHEICVTTLNTEYQRMFRKVLRSALNNVRGTATTDMDQYKARTRAFLMRYRWNRGGKGLAL